MHEFVVLYCDVHLAASFFFNFNFSCFCLSVKEFSILLISGAYLYSGILQALQGYLLPHT